MPAFQRDPHRFLCQGVCLTAAPDTMPQGKWPLLQNIRAYQAGTIAPRFGMSQRYTTGASTPVHSLARLLDPTGIPVSPSLVLAGVGSTLYAGPDAPGVLSSVFTGFSGHPLSILSLQPPASPTPWFYVTDSAVMRKINADHTVYTIGTDSPTQEPDVEVFDLGINAIAVFDSGLSGWESVGDAVLGGIGGAFPRVDTTIDQIYFDGSTPGNASIVPVVLEQIGEGMLILADGADTIAVSQITIAVATTTIAGIIYDSGTSGDCTIQPTASLGTGQLFNPYQPSSTEFGGIASANAEVQSIISRTVPLGRGGVPNPGFFDASADKPKSLLHQVDFPVNCLVKLNGSETVRILSVATGHDGVQSFRCSTAGTFHVGDTIEGVAGFRAFVPHAYTPGTTLSDLAATTVITPPDPNPPGSSDITTATATAGIISPVDDYNLAQITVGGAQRPILGQDDLHLAIRVSVLPYVKTVRVYFDVDPSDTHDFTQNYYFFEWGANDLITATQTVNTAPVAPIPTGPAITGPTVLKTTVEPLPFGGSIEKGGTILQPPVIPVSSDPLGLGNEQWLDLRCKISQLIHVGTETSKTLADVKRVEILVSMESPVITDGDGTHGTAISVKYDSLYISGGFGPDTGGNPNPYFYRYSYRSSKTGVISNPAPATKRPVRPRRQRVTLTPEVSSDPQIDLVDWWRMGGILVRETYIGTGFNSDGVFYDDVGDDAVVDGPTVVNDNFRPWPTTDTPKQGTCAIAGNAIRWLSGDHFALNWAEGSTIVVNNRVYTLAQPPLSTTLILLTTNAGVGSPANFAVPNATLMGMELPVLFGGPIGGTVFTFACGDPLNPGALYWTKPNLPDMASDRNSLLVCTPSEPLQNGVMDDGLPYVFSTDHLYVLEPTFSAPNSFRAQITPCGRGLWCRHGLTITPQGIAFIAKDGIYLTKGGAPAVSLTDADLYPLFPHDGKPGSPVSIYAPPDMTQTDRLRLTYCDGWLYFDYLDTTGNGRTLAFRLEDQSWWPDVVTPGVSARFWASGLAAHDLLIGGATGKVYHPSGISDAGSEIVCEAQIVHNQGDPRLQKIYRDCAIQVSATGAVSAAFSGNNGQVTFAVVALTPILGVRDTIYTDFNPTSMDAYAENITCTFSFTPQEEPSVEMPFPRPIWYWYDIGFQAQGELSTNWLSGPTTHGLPGFQQVPLILIAYRSDDTVTFNVIIDGTLYQYPLPSTGGVYAKKFIRLASVKGLTYQYGIQAPAQAAFLLFDQDCEIWVQPWGTSGGYQHMKPFSGASAGVLGVR